MFTVAVFIIIRNFGDKTRAAFGEGKTYKEYNEMKGKHSISSLIQGALPIFAHHIGSFFYRKSTIGTTKAAIEGKNDTYCLQKRIEKFPLVCVFAVYIFSFTSKNFLMSC